MVFIDGTKPSEHSWPMARKPRIELAGAIYHLRARGIRSTGIFAEREDSESFLKALAAACAKAGWYAHAFCLMPDHFHLLMETTQPNLSTGMKWLLGSFAAAYNRHHGQKGHLFSGRYSSQIVEMRLPYFLAVSDYLHTNPIRAGQCSAGRLQEFPWSSLSMFLLPPSRRPKWLRADRLFAAANLQDTAAGRRSLLFRLGSPEALAELHQLEGQIRSAPVLGSPNFLDAILRANQVQAKHLRHDRQPGSTEAKAEVIVKEVMSMHGWNESQLKRSRKGDPRKLTIAQRLRAETTVPLSWITRRLNMGTTTHLSHLLYWAQRKEREKQDADSATAGPSALSETILRSDPSEALLFDPCFD